MTQLPRTARDLLAEWELAVDGDAVAARSGFVLPVTAASGRAVLKIAAPDDESRHEILALQTWHGQGAVMMLRADPRRGAMLLERLHERDLDTLPAPEAAEVVAGLYRTLHVPAPPQLVPLTRRVTEWTDALERLPRDAPVPRRIVQHAVHLGRGFATGDTGPGRLLHGDLHDGNVLAADREPWLAVSPRPLSGDPHAEPAPLLWNRWDEVVATGDVRRAVRRRFHAVVDAAGLDEERARDWVIVRVVHRALSAIGTGDPDAITAAIAIAKAVQD
jgi:streptomycin 6-kinase